jgi:hypothetical protein
MEHYSQKFNRIFVGHILSCLMDALTEPIEQGLVGHVCSLGGGGPHDKPPSLAALDFTCRDAHRRRLADAVWLLPIAALGGSASYLAYTEWADRKTITPWAIAKE